MNKMAIGIVIGSLIGFIIGLITSPQIEKLLTPGWMRVQGNLEYASAGDPSASGNDPQGHYIVKQTRFYITPVGKTSPMQKQADLVDKVVGAKGTLKLICGSDTFPCYPLIQTDSIETVINK
jgi:hypothetical protein